MPDLRSTGHDPVRVCVIGPSLDIIGGQSVQAQLLVDGLRQSNCVVVSFLPVNPRLPGVLRALQRVKYVRTVVTSIVYVWSLVRIARSHEVLHAFSASYWSYLLAPLPAIFIGRLFGRKTVLNYHSGEAGDHLANWKGAVPSMRRFATRIVVPSGYLVRVFADFGLTADAIANVVPVAHLPYRRRTSLRPHFLSNRNLESLYNVSCILKAFAAIQASYPDAQLTIAGDGHQRAELETLARSLSLRNVHFVGRIKPDAMGALYDAADMFLNSPNIDNMPLSIIEAFACGLPVVSTNAGGIPYVVTHNETGLLVACDDHEAMAVSAIQLLQEPTTALRLADAARAECEARYTWPHVQREWEQLYLSLAGRC